MKTQAEIEKTKLLIDEAFIILGRIECNLDHIAKVLSGK